ncbi:type II toxin-antitoxin system VapC family toxin [soil metagenome]
MILSVDSSVVIAILKGEARAADWLRLLTTRRHEARLVVCDIAYAELAALFESEAPLRDKLEKLAIRYDAIRDQTAFVAGQMFAKYRRAGGPRTSLIPDFLIGAHALGQADGLLTPDRGYLRRYFEGLQIHQPAGPM